MLTATGHGPAAGPLTCLHVLRRRPQLLWLLVPYALHLGALPFVNRVRPVVLGLPFLFFWLLGATLLTPVAVWLTRRGDRR